MTLALKLLLIKKEVMKSEKRDVDTIIKSVEKKLKIYNLKNMAH